MDKDFREFYDEFIRFKREVTDTLENLDEGNFSGNMKKLIARLGGASAGFEAYADAKQAVARMFAEYKTEISKSIANVEAIADANGASITQLVTWQGNIDTSINDLQLRDGTLAESISKIEQTANGNGATIASLVEWKGDAQKSAASIEQVADAIGAFVSMLAVASPFGIDTSKGYKYDAVENKYIFKNGNGEDVEVYSADFAGIYISAMNNNYSEIRLNADVIKFGDYAGVDSIGNFYSKKLFGSASGEYIDGNNIYPGFFYAEVDSGGFTEDNKLYGADFYIKSVIPFYGTEGTVIYGFHYGTTPGETSESINFVIGEQGTSNVKSVWGYNYGKNAFFPKGVWDFSSCSVSNIPLYFS